MHSIFKETNVKLLKTLLYRTKNDSFQLYELFLRSEERRVGKEC